MLFLIFLLLTSPGAGAGARCSPATALKTYEKCMNLPTQDASLAWTFHPRNATLDLAFSGTFISPSGWIAVGINPNSPAMSGARALISFADPNSGALLVLPFILDPSTKLQRTPLVSQPLDLPVLSSSAALLSSPVVGDGAAIHIHATLRLSPNRTHLHLVWNRGLYVQGYSPTIHPTTAADLASRATVDLLSAAASQARSTLPDWFRSAHGAINAVSWGFLLPAGAMAARYLRQWPGVGPAWFYAHAAAQMVGLAAGVVGFGMGVAMGRASEGVEYGMHRGLAVAAVAAGGLQAAAVMFRPGAAHRLRKYWRSYHHLVGYGLVVVGVVNVFQGMEVMGLRRSYAKLAYCVALATAAGACVALEANAWVVFCRKAEEDKVRREEVGDGRRIRGGGAAGATDGCGVKGKGIL
ncbi:Auxin-induced in root cultures protein 12 [Apostasia shenzhenica]|uniref:Cytochrome b561 and DOMON domain-containing protein n=1 Tax=Apostasia shenzhenica TaxID=1088818 RepID=A0A2I0A2R1_9ASPA|nr:Auxin-induced in root cultures protein 12 [Apostasia shenzhenica]